MTFTMIDTALAFVSGLIDRYGLVVLLLAFVLEGMLVGKLLPTRALLIAVVLGLGTGIVSLVSVFAAVVVGGTVGQCLLFVAVRWWGLDLEGVPRIAGHTGATDSRLDRFGLPAVALSNVLPGLRGTLTIPVALSEVSAPRFGLWSLFGTVAYVVVLVVLAVLIDGGAAVALGR